MSNPLFVAGYNGAGFFSPIEIFDADTSNALMTLLLLHDLRNPQGPAYPHTQLDTPMELFSAAAVHGGMWRLPYRMRTVIEVAVVLFLTQHEHHLISISNTALPPHRGRRHPLLSRQVQARPGGRGGSCRGSGGANRHGALQVVAGVEARLCIRVIV
jgi:hypothetical protein